MPKFQRKYVTDFCITDIYDLIVDIEKYPEFLPWCSHARLIEESDSLIIADLVIKFKAFTEHYRSRVKLTPPKNGKATIEVTLISGPFKYLKNVWYLTACREKTKIYFMVDFEFKSFLLEQMIGLVFASASKKMVEAFLSRANNLYQAETHEPANFSKHRGRAKKT